MRSCGCCQPSSGSSGVMRSSSMPLSCPEGVTVIPVPRLLSLAARFPIPPARLHRRTRGRQLARGDVADRWEVCPHVADRVVTALPGGLTEQQPLGPSHELSLVAHGPERLSGRLRADHYFVNPERFDFLGRLLARGSGTRRDRRRRATCFEQGPVVLAGCAGWSRSSPWPWASRSRSRIRLASAGSPRSLRAARGQRAGPAREAPGAALGKKTRC